MRSDIATNGQENRHFRHQTPHNHALRIINLVAEDAVVGRLVAAFSAALIVVLALMLRVLTAPVKVSPDLVKVPMVAMVCSSSVSRDCAYRGLDGDRQAEGDRRRRRQARSATEDGDRPGFLPREEWPRRGPACGVRGQGKKAGGAPLRLRRSRRQPAFGQIKPEEDARSAVRQLQT